MKVMSLIFFLVVSMVVVAGPAEVSLAGPCNPNVTTC
jgi:hypothetical protein